MAVWQTSNLRRLRIGEENKIEETKIETTGQKYNGLPYSIGRPQLFLQTKDTTKRLLFVGWKQQLSTSADVGFGITRVQVALATFHRRQVPSREQDNRLSFSNDQTKSTRQIASTHNKWAGSHLTGRVQCYTGNSQNVSTENAIFGPKLNMPISAVHKRKAVFKYPLKCLRNQTIFLLTGTEIKPNHLTGTESESAQNGKNWNKN